MLNGPVRNEDNEIVVAVSHVPAVRSLLGRWAAGTETESSEALGLARVRLNDLRATADDLRRRAMNPPKGYRPPAEGAVPEKPLDQVLWALRELATVTYAGWQPTVGKNRRVELSKAGGGGDDGRISYGGVGHPQLVDETLSWPSRSTGPGSGVRVGVLDTGLFPQPWLAGGWSARYSDLLLEDDALPLSAGHATFVTGLVLSQAPGATVEVRSLLSAEDGTADSWTAAQQIVEFGETGLDVLNLSFACFTEDEQPPMAIATAIDRLDPKIVVVAAAGNHGKETGRAGRRPAYPAALDDVVAVGATDEHGRRAAFSPADAPWVDVLAPGENVLSTLSAPAPGAGSEGYNGFARWSGTSFATALVSGQIAAGTVPGRISARESWDNIRHALARRSAKDHPPFLALRTPTDVGP